MQTFQCTQCGSLVFFDSQTCVNCASVLGFDPTSLRIFALQALAQATPQASDEPIDGVHIVAMPPCPAWVILNSIGMGLTAVTLPAEGFKFCQNHCDEKGCNFLLPAHDPHEYCLSCRQTETTPDLSDAGNLHAWITIENAKRRLYYTLAKLGLEGAQQAPEYDFLEDTTGEDPVMTGHANGLITLNIAEADDAERTRRRISLHEPYRTLIGHLRHEVGHFYWDQFFLNDPPALDAFRQLFGDERLDYGEALQQHYQAPNPNWQTSYVSSYASSHAWEDWAETWAHYLHLMDLLETAASYQLHFSTVGPQGLVSTVVDNPFTVFLQAPFDGTPQDIGVALTQSMGLSLVLNSLNRSLGHHDAYPFALSSPVLEKLGFVHNAVRRYVHQKTHANTALTAPVTQAEA